MNHWMIFAVKLGISSVVGAGLAWGISFAVADYVVKASVSGLTVSVQNLQASLDSLSATVRQVDQDLRVEVRRFDDGRSELAREIAKEVAKIQTADAVQSQQMQSISAKLERIEVALDNIRGTLRINYANDNGGFIGVGAFKDIQAKYGVDPNTPVLIFPSKTPIEKKQQ